MSINQEVFQFLSDHFARQESQLPFALRYQFRLFVQLELVPVFSAAERDAARRWRHQVDRAVKRALEILVKAKAIRKAEFAIELRSSGGRALPPWQRKDVWPCTIYGDCDKVWNLAYKWRTATVLEQQLSRNDADLASHPRAARLSVPPYSIEDGYWPIGVRPPFYVKGKKVYKHEHESKPNRVEDVKEGHRCGVDAMPIKRGRRRRQKKQT